MDLIPPGKYRARAIDAALGMTSKGHEQVVVKFEILEEGYERRTITWFGVFATDKMSKRILEGLRYCGWSGTDPTDLESIGDKEVELDVVHEEWQGRTNARVRWVNRLGGGVVVKAPIPTNRLEEFRSRMQKLAPPAPAPEPAPAPIADDDIPF